MSNLNQQSSKPPPETDPQDRIQFAEHHRIGLEAGDYELVLNQSSLVDGVQRSADSSGDLHEARQSFSVVSDQYGLEATGVHGVFPPAGSRGNYWHVLPHVILNRSTLPWERSALTSAHNPATDPPWLALLLFHSNEVPTLETVKVSQLLQHSSDPVFPALQAESSQHADDQVQVISVERQHLDAQFSKIDLNYQTHVRRRLAYLGDDRPAGTMPVTEQVVANAVRQVALSQKLPVPPFDLPDSGVVIDQIHAGYRWRVRDQSHHQAYEVWLETTPTRRLVVYRVDTEKALVMGNRFPQPGVRNVAYLVSVERRFTGSPLSHQFAYPSGTAATKKVRLISLRQWEFYCLDPARTFKWMLEGLNARALTVSNGVVEQGGLTDAASINVSQKALKDANQNTIGRIVSGDSWNKADHIINASVVDQSNNTVPVNGTIIDLTAQRSPAFHVDIHTQLKGTEAEPFLRAGLTPMRHRMRDGGRSVSWYHGPFVPEVALFADPTGALAQPQLNMLPARSADQLLVWDARRGMLNCAYAAAWELGRMLMLQNTRVAEALYDWKRHHQHSLHRTRRTLDLGYPLPIVSPSAGNAEHHATTVNQWLAELDLLMHVPFNYLVPDEDLLPTESLRLFSVDPVWMACVRDGAFSIGRVPAYDVERQDINAIAVDEPVSETPAHPRSGALIRSEVVSGWPGLLVDGWKTRARQSKSTILRMERLSKNVLLVLFTDQIEVIDVHLRPETLHFGFDVSDTIASQSTSVSTLTKRLRDRDGNEVTHSAPSAGVPITHYELSNAAGFINPRNRVLDIHGVQRQLAVDLASLPAAPAVEAPSEHGAGTVVAGDTGVGIFAAQMVAGVERVQFIRRRRQGHR